MNNEISKESVIDDFDYSTQGASYNKKFISWRKRSVNPFSFRFEKIRNESVYIDGRGFVVDSADSAEHDALIRIFYVLGIACLMWVVIDTIFSKILVFGLEKIGFDIHSAFMSSTLYGGGVEIVSVLAASAFLKVFVPFFYLRKRFKLPKQVELMSSANRAAGIVGAIAMVLIISTVTSLPSAYSSETKEIYEYFASLNTDVSVWGQREYLFYTIFDIVIMSALSEMFFRGAMFAVLRQFGDPFAIIVTSLTAGLLTQNFQEMLTVILISIVASWGMLRSGTIFTAIASSIIYKMYRLAITILEANRSDTFIPIKNFFMIVVFIVGAVVLLIVWLLGKQDDEHYIAEFHSKMTMRQRIIHSAKVFPYSVVMAICAVYAVIRLVT